MMTLNDYREQFRRNLIVMSRTAVGTLDLSASATKADSMAAGSADDAQNLALVNTDRAIDFLFENRVRSIKSQKDMEDLILQTAEITNKGIVKEGRLFRSGEDSTKFPYARIKDIPEIWDWFTNIFHWMLNSQCFEVEEVAAFSEYVINIAGHFFSDGCGKISMLISTYVFMRYGLPCPMYRSRDEFYRAGVRKAAPTLYDMRHLPADSEFWEFVTYYQSLCPSKGRGYYNYLKINDDGSFEGHLIGYLTDMKSHIFRQNLEEFYRNHPDAFIEFDCRELAWIDMEGIRVLADMRESSKKFLLKNLNADCKVLFNVEGFEEYIDKDDKLREIDLSSCERISEGANGVIYRVSDEVVAKTFKNEPDYYDIVRQRVALKNALISGVPAPISFGYARYKGKIVTLMELIHSKSLMQIILTEDDIDRYIVRYAQFVRQFHEIREESKLKNFMRDLFGEEILAKADRCDSVLPEEYRGRARKIIEAVDEPECLVHGDIQPNNVMVSEEEMLFIDFDSFSTGKAVYDIGTLYRTLLCNENRGFENFNSFLKIPFDKCERIWDTFVREYYKDEPDETAQKKILEAELIGTVLALAKHIKSGARPGAVDKGAADMVRLINEILYGGIALLVV